jgi:hypothetical protein
MKKKLIILSLCVLSFIAGIVFTSVIPSSSAAKDGINRTLDLIYPDTDYFWEQSALIYPQTSDIFYHDSVHSCDFADPDDNLASLDVSIYEAVIRGYQPCPNCFRPEVEISPYQWGKMIKEK